MEVLRKNMEGGRRWKEEDDGRMKKMGGGGRRKEKEDGRRKKME